MGQSVRKVRVGVIVFNAEDEVLLCRQNNKPFWVLPGGTLEPGETILACAERELKEETALDITDVQIVGLADFLRPEEPHVIDITCVARLVGGRLVMETDENLNDIGFFSQSQLSQMVIKPDYIAPLLLKHWVKKDFLVGTYFGAL